MYIRYLDFVSFLYLGYHLDNLKTAVVNIVPLSHLFKSCGFFFFFFFSEPFQ